VTRGVFSTYAMYLVLAAYLVVASGYVFITPLWQAPDEPAHYNYVQHLVLRGSLPVLQEGDYPHQYLEELKAAGFPEEMSVASIRYEGHQPPLYYFLGFPVLSVVQGFSLRVQVYALRLLSVLLGSAVVVLAHCLGRVLWPQAPLAAVALAGVVAFVPMHTAVCSAINNDVLAEALVLATALASARLFRWQPTWHGGESLSPRPETGEGSKTPGRCALQKQRQSHPRAVVERGGTGGLGLLLGLCLITKTTAFIAVPLAVLALGAAWWHLRASLRAVVRALPAMLLPAATISGPWLLRNMAIYGIGDPLGLERHNAIVAGQLTAGERLAQIGPAAMVREGAITLFRSFWGMFGWMGVPMDERLYYVLALVTVLAMVGVALWLWRSLSTRWSRRRLALSVMLASWGLMSIVSLVWYNLQFVQYQGRYLFPALPVWAALLVQGVREVGRRSLAVARVLLGLAAVVYGAGVVTGDTHILATGLLVVAAFAVGAGGAMGRRAPGLACALGLAMLWSLDLAGALYYVNKYL